ncbi:phosphatidylinositol 3-kinase catalytic subunit-like protein [Sarcoptes scabiei]|uniref:phosphatidylinositol 3-kinase n=1 Tax=Sarcoptes scabiei TaxID=52283 RepID=A0A131ZU97_SARSC|nr:phosphatidylinositol 3-kinase catalytic subunit-like protein [Sarcoptes scabiei]
MEPHRCIHHDGQNHQHLCLQQPFVAFCHQWSYLPMTTTDLIDQYPNQNLSTGNLWLTSCPLTKMSSSYKSNFEKLNSKLRDESQARLEQLISLPEDSDQPVDIDVLMPNGTIISINIAQNATFIEIKDEVFELSQRGPMYGALRDRKQYSFSYVDELGSYREIENEEIRLCDACPVANLLKLVEHQVDSADIEFDEQIGQLIGKPLKEFDALLNPEVNDFRYRIRSLCEDIVEAHRNNSWLDKMRYAYPVSVDTTINTVPDYLKDRLPPDGMISVEIIFIDPEETILSNYPIKLAAIRRQSIEFEEEPIYADINTDFRLRSHSLISLGSLSNALSTFRRRPQQIISSWSLDRKLLIKIHSAHINHLQFNNDITRVAVVVGIFHGGEILCDSHMTVPVTLADLVKSSSQNPNMEIIDTISWEEDIVFNLKVSDLPRMARISFTVVGFTGSQSHKKLSQSRQSKPIPIAWANINFFDYRGHLWESSTTLSMWLHDNDNECFDDAHSVFNPLGTVVPNPNIDQTIFLTISFTKYSEGDNTIIRFPNFQDILKQFIVNDLDDGKALMNQHNSKENDSESIVETLIKAQSLPPLRKISSQSECSEDESSEDSANHLGKALELLDYAYADSLVRKFAIECLKGLPDEELSQYLLQLVQALKYESYIYNDLILSRQMDSLNKLKRINIIVRDDKSRENREKKIGWMQEILAQKFYQDTFSNVINPLNPVYKLGRLKVKKCKFMDSKMKPLWLVFENIDKDANDIYVIFKNGDDLRQDMLTLQMIRIMDRLWKDAGYDFRMTPYRCISVEHCVGLIEVVLDADTIANIQKKKGAAAIAAFKKGSLLAWLRDHNPDEADLNKAIEEFTLSCAGYCVVTYILGVADRHNDNIMVKKNGQLFHIDFGHILGKFKEKFGIRRERVPFVLTNDFVYVITHGGQSSKKSEYFQRFQQYCEEAFIIIRRQGSFLISLFAMMLSTGIPEISSVNDLQYLRETLVLDKSEDEARSHFNAKFMDALKNSWKTSFNWCAHSLAKDNRMNDR